MLLFPNMNHLHIPGSVEALAGDINHACVPQGRKEQMLLFPHLVVYRNWQNQPQNKPLPECTGWRGKSSSQQKGTAVPKGVRRTQTHDEEPARVIRHSRQEKPGRVPHIPLIPRTPSSFTCIDSMMQHKAPGMGPLVSKAVLLWVDWEPAAPQAASIAIPWDAPFCQGNVATAPTDSRSVGIMVMLGARE